MKYIKLSCILVLFFVSCISSVTKRNDPGDINQANGYANRFYSLIGEQNYEEAANCFAPNLSHEEAVKILSSINSLRGDLMDATTTNVGTVVNTKDGQIIEVEISVTLNCKYVKGATSETLTVKGNNFETLKIAGYQFDLK